MRVLAEGIETTPQLRFMARYGCDMLQGYLMSRPVPTDELVALLAKRPDLRPDGATDGEHARDILVVEDEPLEAELLAMDLENEGYRVYLCEDMEGALGILDRERIDLVLSDHYLRGETTGVQLLRKLLRLFPDIPRVMMSGT
jgi:PleD family two-component response regulator